MLGRDIPSRGGNYTLSCFMLQNLELTPRATIQLGLFSWIYFNNFHVNDMIWPNKHSDRCNFVYYFHFFQSKVWCTKSCSCKEYQKRELLLTDHTWTEFIGLYWPHGWSICLCQALETFYLGSYMCYRGMYIDMTSCYNRICSVSRQM